MSRGLYVSERVSLDVSLGVPRRVEMDEESSKFAGATMRTCAKVPSGRVIFSDSVAIDDGVMC